MGTDRLKKRFVYKIDFAHGKKKREEGRRRGKKKRKRMGRSTERRRKEEDEEKRKRKVESQRGSRKSSLSPKFRKIGAKTTTPEKQNVKHT